MPIIILGALLTLISCRSLEVTGMLVGSSPHANERFADSKKYNDANGFKTITVQDNEYSVYVCTDAHVTTSANALSCFVDNCVADKTAAPFAIFLGDATSTTSFNQFEQCVSPLERAGITLFRTPGNHDLYFSLWSEYLRINNTSSYYFKLVTPSDGTDLFICLDSASGTLGADQRAWLGDILSDAKGKYRRITVFTHTHFFKRDISQEYTSNFNLEEGYDLEKLFSDSGVSLVLSGHDHFFEDTLFKNVRYLTLAAIEDGGNSAYYIFNFRSGDFSFKEVRSAKGNQ